MRLKLIKKGNFARQWVSGTTKNYFYARLYGCDRPSTQQTYRSIKSGDTKLHINNRSLWQQIGGGRKIFLKLKCLRAGLFQNWWMDLNALLGRILWVRLGEMEAIKSTKGQKWKINMQLRGKFSSFINLAMWVFSEAGSIVCVVNISYPRLKRSHIGCGRFTLLAMCSIRDWLRVCHTSDILPFEQVKSFLSHVDHTYKHTCKSARSVLWSRTRDSINKRIFPESNLIGLHHAAPTITQSKFMPCDSVFFPELDRPIIPCIVFESITNNNNNND